MKRFTTLLVIGVLIAGTVSSTIDDGHEQTYLIRVTAKDLPATATMLQRLDFDLTGVDPEASTLDAITDDAGLTLLEQRGIPYIIVTEYSAISSKDISQYLDPKEGEQKLKQLAHTYPTLTNLVQVGLSLEKRPILALKISDNAALREDEPSVLFNGMHHAREVMTAEVVFDTAEFLLSRYGKDPKVTQWVDSIEIWIMPHVNPDGNQAVFDGNRWWRKNRRVVSEKITGVDLNRNYPFWWAACGGSSSSPNSETYHGTGPASEPEASAVVTLAREIRPVLDISYHSYSELILYPYGCQGKKSGEHAMLKDLGDAMSAVTVTDSGTGRYRSGLPWEILYGVAGDDLSWMHAELGTLAYVFELNGSSQGFQPDYDKWRTSTIERMRPAWSLMLDRLDGPMLTGHVTDASNGKPLVAAVTISAFALTNAEPARTTEPRFGRYFRPVLPGTYEVIFSAPGYLPVTKQVAVGKTPLLLDISLQPQG
ncbi:MAG: hypothetical protein A2284_12155 [Deltaproteobacteria bacterium RIFOXYA12_FULL_61_11]|nr:MAG: hypothetical protein A2284_12155 [Deltaproteobacteria bacterium RIFOXYA12_FULL_61_11]